MKAKIVITTAAVEDGEYKGLRRSEVWTGELDILNDQEYLLRFAIIGDGLPQPIVDLPFAIGLGHYLWIPPDNAPEDEGWYIENESELH